MVHKWIENKLDVNLTYDQLRFRRNRGTREAISSLRLIIENMFRINKPSYIV